MLCLADFLSLEVRESHGAVLEECAIQARTVVDDKVASEDHSGMTCLSCTMCGFRLLTVA